MSTIKVKNIQHPSADEPAIVLNPDGTINVDINELESSSLYGGGFSLRNKLINGRFDIWQRGTTFSGEGYSADRWYSTGDCNRVFGPAGVTDYGLQVSSASGLILQGIELSVAGRAGEFQPGTKWYLSWYQNNNIAASTSSIPVSYTHLTLPTTVIV